MVKVISCNLPLPTADCLSPNLHRPREYCVGIFRESITICQNFPDSFFGSRVGPN